jgi:hypothetical protein
MWQRLGDVCEVRTGYQFRSRIAAEPLGDHAVIQIRDVEQQTWLTPDRLIMVSNPDGRFDKHQLIPGDVLFQSRGTRNLAATFFADIPAVSAPGLFYLRPVAKKLEPDYLEWALNHPQTRVFIREITRGSHIEFIPKSDLERIRIPVPPLLTQRQIANVATLRARSRDLAGRYEKAQDDLANAATWKAATTK